MSLTAVLQLQAYAVVGTGTAVIREHLALSSEQQGNPASETGESVLVVGLAAIM